ncbi:MAG: methyltransferase family protein, partial [Promethearchaeota archaeon]
LKSNLKLYYSRLSPLLAYFPIIAGILSSMAAIPALAYISWNIFYLWPGFDLMASWIFYLNGYTTNFPINSLLWIELIIFICGFSLFLHGLTYLVKAKKKNIAIVQTGLYKYIRHPQNLGIIIFSLPFCLYVPFLGDHGLKVGDIFSWILFCLLMIIYSDIEEIHMLRKFPEEYRLYKFNTGLFLPKIIKSKRKNHNLSIETYVKRWFYLIVGFILIIVLLTLIIQNLPIFILFLSFYSDTTWNFIFIFNVILFYVVYYEYKAWRDLRKQHLKI